MAIQISRVKDPQQTDDMVEHFTFLNNDPQTKELFLKNLVNAMTNSPDSIFVIQARKEGESVGFVVANVQTETPFVCVSQAWSRSSNGQNVATQMFMRTLLWTVGMGRTSMRAETDRDLAAFYKRFKFEPVSTVVEFSVTPEVRSILYSRGNEVLDGRILPV